MLRFIIIILAFLVICAWCLWHCPSRIQADITERANASLGEINANKVLATASGRDVLLTGSVESKNALDDIIDAVENTWGVRTIEHTLAINDATYEWDKFHAAARFANIDSNEISMKMNWHSGNVSLSGHVANEREANNLKSRVNPQLNIYDHLKLTTLSSGSWPDDWHEMNNTILSSILDLESARAHITHDSIKIYGEAKDDGQREKVEQYLRSNLNADKPLSLNISIPLSSYARACQEKLKDKLKNNSIEFSTASTSINPESTEFLERLIATINSCPKTRILIAGHTDSQGEEANNQTLSENRANSVKNYLVENGINAQRLSTIGFGELRPIESNSTEAGMKKNRRIEFIIVGEEE